jgi:hypothetical protein
MWKIPPSAIHPPPTLSADSISVPSGGSYASRRNVTGTLEPAMSGNFNSRDQSYICLAFFQS